ncbi:uncharacterized protein DUF4317 [Streptohalobacillus salinus]|uniref:Uncharacterized protein DUF4317 n=1 Tax=Streptohalobacillus salinus TaxID=621096 RepID=A0A2V3W2L9_9BACI|nr:DUF4317 family protein [Streptohalobacillus salinus]PXW87331.1 uncharacterized protein DUF4317 [Streptohalobacillus salinus]
MNKKDIADIRKQFKRENDLLHIQEILSVYVTKETREIYHEISRPFSILDDDEQELFHTNFKKVLTGNLDEKLFELKFQQEGDDRTQLLLNEALITEDRARFKELMLIIVDKMLEVREYEHDLVITFIKGDYLKPTKKKDTDDDFEHKNDLAYDHQFILSTVNKTQDPPKDLLFDYVEKLFKYQVIVDPVINIKAPIGGFLFPCFTEHAADVNHILYAAPKANEPDEAYILDVLNAEETVTQQEDKAIFEGVVRGTVGHQIGTDTLAGMYGDIYKRVEEAEAEDEIPTLDYKDISELLTANGVQHVEPEQVKTALHDLIDDDGYQLKAKNIVPKYKSKSIKINTKIADVKVSPEDLRYVKQTQMFGRRYLMIEVDEETVVDGFTMIPEVFGEKQAAESPIAIENNPSDSLEAKNDDARM